MNNLGLLSPHQYERARENQNSSQTEEIGLNEAMIARPRLRRLLAEQLADLQRLQAAQQDYQTMLGEFEEINNSTAELMQNLSGIRAMMGYVGRELTNLRRLTDLRDQISTLQQQKPRLSQQDIDK